MEEAGEMAPYQVTDFQCKYIASALLDEEITVVKEIGRSNELVKSRELFLIQGDTTALCEFTHFTLRGKAGSVFGKKVNSLTALTIQK